MDWGNLIINRSQSTSFAFNISVIRICFRYIASLIQACILFSFVILYILLSIPVFIYRILITNLVAPLFHPRIGKAVTVVSNAYATDLYHSQRAPRTAIVVDLVLEGNLPFEEALKLVSNNLVNATSHDNGQLLYPELRQYVEPWMGFLFWKQDSKFNLNNHVKFHKLEEKTTEVESEVFVCQLIEELLNNTFPAKKSPWEMHLIHNYKMKGNTSPSSLVIFRFQHCIADGYSILYALVETLGKVSLRKMSTLPPLQEVSSKENSSFLGNVMKVLGEGFQFVRRALHDVDYAMTLFYRAKSPWYIPDENKQWKQLFARSDLISMEKLKEIKNRLGVSFTGVILSGISAGVSQSLKSKGKGGNKKELVEVLPTFSTIPLAGHPKGLSNHHAGVVFDIPVKIDLNPVDRLVECEYFLGIAKQSLLMPLGVAVWKLLGCQLAALNSKLFANPIVPAFLTNFPGPSFPVEVHGRKLLGASFAVGAGSGVAGIGFMAFSYHDQMRIVLTAENAAMTREELQRMLNDILKEFDSLHEIALSKIPPKKQQQRYID